jgi:ribosome-associated heat shock protein Hsp15
MKGDCRLVYERGMRIDKWLWFSRLSASRSEAQQLCGSRRLRLNGRVIDRSCTIVRPGSIISYPKGEEVIAVRVELMADHRGPSTEARSLYTQLLPAPSAHLARHPGLGDLAPACAVPRGVGCNAH